LQLNLTSKLHPVFIVVSALIGILLGRVIAGVDVYAGKLIEVFLMVLLFVVFLSVDIKKITQSFSNLKFSISAFAINFIWTPIFAFGLGKFLLRGEIDLQIGFIMLLVTPCTDWYLIFTGLAKGNVALGASILPLNLIVQILMLPVYLQLFMASSVSFDPFLIAQSIVLVLVIPMGLANLIKLMANTARARRAKINPTPQKDMVAEIVSKYSDNLQLLFLCLAVIAMFASQGNLLFDNYMMVLKIFPPLIIFFAVNFLLALLAGKIAKLPFADTIALLFTTSARNSPISLAIAIVTFPARPIIALVLVIGPLIEIPILALNASILKKQRLASTTITTTRLSSSLDRR
jgi:ACR3 family arsenite efflux pump ArsB